MLCSIELYSKCSVFKTFDPPLPNTNIKIISYNKLYVIANLIEMNQPRTFMIQQPLILRSSLGSAMLNVSKYPIPLPEKTYRIKAKIFISSQNRQTKSFNETF